ncbi:uncharacterized protein HKW66_Vig0118830 [Vigna angularis]|uniref:Leucine-rich repeat-containing N-terminal plant-type domain-containing protein n=1 Tax=Phaseolus angularis TaxID=3914 RepID=A0A8T0JYT1_PHAAN|nr:uncharacterized protein HKW66_Vig0118830 [Vigna angularis]
MSTFGVCRGTVCVGSERETLLKLKHHLIDPSNRLSSWNASLNPNCCHWYGVLCNNVTSHVAELHLNTPLPLYDEILGPIPDGLRNLTLLENLDLNENSFSHIPDWFYSSFPNLKILRLSGNNFHGTISDALRNVTSLVILDLSSNKFEGPIPTSFGYLCNLRASFLNFSHNHIHGELGKNPISIPVVDLSANDLHGKFPSLSNDVGFLDLSCNSLSKSMDDFLCKNQEEPMKLEFLNLASNNLSGEIPDCWGIWPYLMDVNLQNNNFVGNIPQSIGSLTELTSLRIRKNLLSGTFPTILKKNNKLVLLDLGENDFSGTIPTWVGESFLHMKVFILRSNRFFGQIPNKICDMSLLQVLDLAQNNLTGNIPTCFNRLKAMTQMNRSTTPLIYCRATNYTFDYSDYTVVSVLLWLKGRGDECLLSIEVLAASSNDIRR